MQFLAEPVGACARQRHFERDLAVDSAPVSSVTKRRYVSCRFELAERESLLLAGCDRERLRARGQQVVIFGPRSVDVRTRERNEPCASRDSTAASEPKAPRCRWPVTDMMPVLLEGVAGATWLNNHSHQPAIYSQLGVFWQGRRGTLLTIAARAEDVACRGGNARAQVPGKKLSSWGVRALPQANNPARGSADFVVTPTTASFPRHLHV